MSAFTRHPWFRWMVPAAAVVGIGAVSLAASVAANASTPLPPRTAAQLLVDVQQARLTGLSGTVVQTSELGLPTIPGVSTGGGVGSPSNLTSLVSGTHTLRVWYGGESQQRIALLGSLGESDVIRNGSTVWVWSSQDKTATRFTRPAETGSQPSRPDPSLTPLTPDAAAAQALAAIDPTTKVSTEGTARVAGRAAYELVLVPRDASSLVAQVRIAVDAETHIPLRVQVYSTKVAAPTFQVGFTQVDFGRPQARQFAFNPPPGTTVKDGGPLTVFATPSSDGPPVDAERPRLVGKGWTTVVVTRLPKGDGRTDRPAEPATPLDPVLHSLPMVSGSWGSGRVFAGTLVSAVVTDDGRVAIGAVAPERLYAALTTR